MQLKSTLLVCLTGILTLSATAQWKKVQGNGKITTQNRTAGNFQKISLSGGMNVEITPSSTRSVSVEADENLMEYIITETDGSNLKIKVKEGYSINSKKITVHVSTPGIEAVSVAGSGSISSKGTLSAPGNLKTSIAGSGNIHLAVNTGDVKASIAGSGDISLSGKSSRVEVSISGSGSFKGFEMPTADAQVRISGSGDVETTVNGKIDAVISGSGTVYYKGNGDISMKASGSGKVKKVD